MKLTRISFYLIAALFITSSCTDLTGSSESPENSDFQTDIQILPADDEQLSEEQKTLYLLDAEKLAVRYVNNKDSTQTEIPQSLIDLFYNGLVHIVNSEHPKANEVAALGVHARIPVSSREILVIADTTAPWIDAWRNGTVETGSPEIDQLIEQFNFSLVQYRELENVSPTSTTTLRSNRPINIYAVGRLFSELDYIKGAGPDLITDGSNLSVLFFEDYLRYTFEYGFGDCPAGCINRHIWHFRVYKDGTVEFESESGAPVPNY